MKRKVLFIVNSMRAGGAEKILSDLLERSEHYLEYEIDLLIFDENGPFLSKIPSDKVKVYNFKKNDSKLKWWVLKKVYKYTGIKIFFDNRVKELIKENYDCTISFVEGIPVFLHSFLLNKSRLNLTWVHNDFVTNHWTQVLFHKNDERDIYGRMDKIITVSNSALESFNLIYENNVNKQVIYNFVIKNHYKVLEKTNIFTLCTIGRLETIKNFNCLIRALKIVKEQGYSFKCYIIGEGSERQNLLRDIEKFGLCSEIILTGFLMNPTEYLNNSDMFISTSFSESFSLAIAEALVANKPVIASKTIGACELLKNGQYGILFDIDNEKELAERIIDCMFNRNILANYQLKSKERAAIFELENFVQQLQQVLK
ncbi:glycosyltransferase [Acinetobacter sp. ANC 4173]|uniref:glycosyltransferase n=1 Tax=Acinetobacter sp. ANC 4173 TaxID=2529837 RepID=UPI00103A17AE|nr:glycosyltransferase [Acinetobacter sp. ANC 4173]TCB80459.1 glycosyltransferase [Acinetobacter sp. ANC 4173]